MSLLITPGPHFYHGPAQGVGAAQNSTADWVSTSRSILHTWPKPPFSDLQRAQPHRTLDGASRLSHPAPWTSGVAKGTKSEVSVTQGLSSQTQEEDQISTSLSSSQTSGFCSARGRKPDSLPCRLSCQQSLFTLAASEFELLGEKLEEADYRSQVLPSQAGCALGLQVPLWKSSHSIFSPDAIP